MPDDEELFDHEVTAWTAAQLRKALEGVPDDFPATVWVAEEPGGPGREPADVDWQMTADAVLMFATLTDTTLEDGDDDL